MKAIVCTQYGSPEVFVLRELDLPSPKNNEIVLQVHTAVVTPSDCAFRKGEPFIIKLMYGLTRPKLQVHGVEVVGEVVEVGSQVTKYKKGEVVMGLSPYAFGTQAEYVCLAENLPITPKPTNLSSAEAVAVLDGAPTALTFLRDVAKVRPGQKVLINGASGAVGAYGVQLARYFGAEVTGVCGSTNGELVKGLGATHVIDYTQTDFTNTGTKYDVIFDAVGKSSFSACKKALTAQGVYLTTVPTVSIIGAMLWTAVGRGQKAKFTAAGLGQNRENLLFLKKLAEEGHLKAVIDRSYPLAQVAEAHRYVETGRKKGNVVITVR